VASLEETLAQVRQTNESNPNLYRSNETAVRNHLIDPVLTALGWDVSKHEHVIPNYAIQNQRGYADYALLWNGSPVIMLEAKNQSISLEDQLHQALQYAFDEGADYSLLCNGKEWRLYWSFVERSQPSERLIWSLDLHADEARAGTVLQTIRRRDIRDFNGEIKSYAKRRALQDRWEAFIAEHEKIVAALAPVFRSFRPINEQQFRHVRHTLHECRSFVADQVTRHGIPPAKPGTEVPPAGDPTPPPLLPTGKRIIINGEAIEIKRQKDVLIRTAEWLIEHGKLTPSDCPILSATGRRCIVRSEPATVEGDSLRSARRLSNGIWIELQGDKRTLTARARMLLSRFGFDPNILVVEWDK